MKRFIKYILGFLVSAMLIWLSLKDIDFRNLRFNWAELDYFILSMAVLCFALIPVLKAFRWKLIVQPVQNVRFKKVLPITAFGYMAVLLLPFRLGELFRPYLLFEEEKVPVSTGISTIVVERLFEITGLLIILLLTALNVTLPGHFMSGGITMGVLVLVAFVFMYFFYLRPALTRLITGKLKKFLPGNSGDFIEKIIIRFIKGFASVKSFRSFMVLLLLSLLIWLINALAIFLLLLLFNMQLPLISAFLILTSVLAVISLPAAPGFIGNFQYGTMVALQVFNVAKQPAFVFAMFYYLVSSVVKIIFGLVSVLFIKVSVKNMRELIKTAKQHATGK